MQDIINKQKFETLLLTHWSEFINVRTLIQYSKETLLKYHNLPVNCQVYQLKISRFEFTTKGFLLWIDVILIDLDNKINTTLEVSLSDTNIEYVNSIVD